MVNYKQKYLKYKTKYINSKLNGGMTTTNEDDEEVKEILKFNGYEFNLYNNIITLNTDYPDCKLEIIIENNTMNYLSALDSAKYLGRLNLLYDNDIQYNLRLDKLYKGTSPSGYIKEALCNLLEKLIMERLITLDSIISLEASGYIDGSYLNLLKYYERMSFRIFSYSSANAEFIKDINGKWITAPNSEEWEEEFDEENSELCDVHAAMYTDINSLIRHCESKFSETFKSKFSKNDNKKCNIM